MNINKTLRNRHAVFPHKRASLVLNPFHGCGNSDSRGARPFVTATSTVISGEPFTVHRTINYGSGSRDDNFQYKPDSFTVVRAGNHVSCDEQQ